MPWWANRISGNISSCWWLYSKGIVASVKSAFVAGLALGSPWLSSDFPVISRLGLCKRYDWYDVWRMTLATGHHAAPQLAQVGPIGMV